MIEQIWKFLRILNRAQASNILDEHSSSEIQGYISNCIWTLERVGLSRNWVFFIYHMYSGQCAMVGNYLWWEIARSKIGENAVTNLDRIPQIYQNVCLDAGTVIPNHIYAIILLIDLKVETPHWGVSTKAHNWRHWTLGGVINQYKSSCTKKIRAMGFRNFAW